MAALLFRAMSGRSRIENLDLLVRAFRFELLRSWIGWEDTKLAQQNRSGVSNRVLQARRKDQDIAGAVSLRAILSSRLAAARENDDDFLGYMRMPGNDNAGADYVLVDRHGFGPEARVGDEVSHARLRSAR